MKKFLMLIVIIICSFMLTGCNYIELNDMGIVTLMAIKYENNNYNITLELRENIKEDEEASTFHKASGASIEKALQELALTVDKNLYFIDLNVILIDRNTANEKLTSIVDYLTRDVTFGTNFNIVIDDNAEETLKLINDKKKISGEYIKNIFNNKSNTLINYKYDEFLKNYLSPFKDIILPVGKIENEEYIINEAVIFSDKKIVCDLDLGMIQIYNLLNNDNSEYYFKINYKNKNLVYRVSSHKVKMDYMDNKININVNLNGSFIEIEDIDLLNEDILKEILDILNNKVKKDIDLLVYNIKNDESDIFGFKKLYFNNKKEKFYSIKNLNYTVNVNLDLDREGLLFESIGDVYEENK